ncbi:hypothetical protein BDY21DRAFT_357326 [Lineolata rhizophorae]|uniref:Protein Asterix n=1 Tax=Lineolata rhizophorae TaxID=578093 RepID=A0A6A6NNZ2_9PEZI|nr:hypothetical protein BDY21DRAFT_357326 [Lineolata rhizophorae]
MASKNRDMRRPDLIVPYVEPEKDRSDTDALGTVSSSLPMVAIFMRNKTIGWTAVMFSIQAWLVETPEKRAASTTPGIFSVLMSVMALLVSYMPLFLPPPQQSRARFGSGTEAPPAAPPS